MNKKVLFLVEDEKLIREMYELTLKQAGYEVEYAEDGEEAVQKLTDNHRQFDLILLDIMLPKMDGISVLKKIKEESSPSKNTPVFLLTNLGQESLIKEAMSLGADQYLIKSNIFPMDLAKEIDNFLNQNKSQGPKN